MSDADASPKGKRSLWKRLGCGCLSLLVVSTLGVVALEWFLRSTGGAYWMGSQHEARYLYEMNADGRSCRLRPGWTGQQTIDGRTTQIRVNALGMRGPEVGPRGSGEARVLVLGDSFVFGHGVAEEESIPARLQSRLGVTVGNGGTPSHGTRDLAPDFERWRSFGADVVVACTYLGNDFEDDARESGEIVDGYLLWGEVARAAHESFRVRLAIRYRTVFLLERVFAEHLPALAFDRSQFRRTDAEQESYRRFPPAGAPRDGGYFMDRNVDDALVGQVLSRCRDSYRALSRAAAGVPVLHVIFPTREHLSDAAWQAKLVAGQHDPKTHTRGLVQTRLLQVARDLGLPMLDLTPRFAAAPDRDSLWLARDPHLSAKGCAAVAEWIEADVRKLLGR